MMPTVGFPGVADGRIHDADVAATLLPFFVLGSLIKTQFLEKGYPYSNGSTQEPCRPAESMPRPQP